MARPTKVGLDYFPMDVDMINDEKIEFVSAKFGLKGEAIIGRLLSRIYRNGYYIEWNSDAELLFIKRIANEITVDELREIVEELINRNFFSRKLYDNFGILTSHGIQKRYLKACQDAKRKTYHILKELDLLGINPEETPINSELTGINSELTLVNSEFSAQSKVNKSKVKEIKVNQSKVKETLTNNDLKNFSELFLLTFQEQPTSQELNQISNAIKNEPDIPISNQLEIFKQICKTITESSKSQIKNKPINEKKAYLFGTFKLKQQDYWRNKNDSEGKQLEKEVELGFKKINSNNVNAPSNEKNGEEYFDLDEIIHKKNFK